MDLLIVLPSLNLEQLLYICQRDQIPIFSRSQEFILRASIQKAIYERYPYLRNPFEVNRALIKNKACSKSTAVDFVRNILLELGVNIVSVVAENVGPWAYQVGLPWDYLEHGYQTCQSILAVYLWERGLPAPDIFLQKVKSTNFYTITLEVFRELHPDMFSDETREEYIFRKERSIVSLNYQDLPTLIYLADSISGFLRDGKVYFKTKVGCINYIMNTGYLNGSIRDWVKQVLVSKWRSDQGSGYPDRKALVEAYLKIPGVSTTCFYYFVYSRNAFEEENKIDYLNDILSFPPCRAEEEYLRNFLRLEPTLKGKIVMDILSRKYRTSIGQYDKLSLLNPIDLELKTTRAELVEIIQNKTKKWSQLTQAAIEEACGWVDLNRGNKDRLRMLILEKIGGSRFELITNGRICSNSETTLLEPTSSIPLLISYGKFEEELRGYSIDELDQAFIVNPDYVEFRKPENPRSAFTRTEIEQLYTEINTTNLTLFREINIQNFLNKIRRGLANQFDINRYRDQFQALPQEEINKLKGIFWNLFEAGMYQRRWCGPNSQAASESAATDSSRSYDRAYPQTDVVCPESAVADSARSYDRGYPMKYVQTHGGSQDEISAAMTPSLNNVRDLRASLNPDSLQIFKRLPTLDYMDNYFVTRQTSLNNLINQTIEGNYCVAFASSLAIYSSYKYLQLLGEDIPGFDITQFESSSTHR